MKQTYSLSELCSLISDTLQKGMHYTYWVRAEIVNMNIREGHCYFELAEKQEGSSLFAAKTRAVCWQNVYSMLSSFFSMESGETLHAGLRVLLEVEVCFHAVYGLSLNIVGIDPAYTQGNLQKQKEETILRLQKEGVMGMQQLLALPSLVRRIAVVSSPDAAGYGDFYDQLTSNSFGFVYKIQLFPAIMQGDKSSRSVIAALEAVYDKNDSFDAVVVIRGGGANTDLSCFDDYLLAATCAQFPLPVITGIGHQRDVSVLDRVAHKALKTPTAVAEFLIDRLAGQAEIINSLQQRLRLNIEHSLILRKHLLETCQLQLRSAIQKLLFRSCEKLSACEKILLLLSPENLYKKGYTLTLLNGEQIGSCIKVKRGDTLVTEFVDGKVKSIVME